MYNFYYRLQTFLLGTTILLICWHDYLFYLNINLNNNNSNWQVRTLPPSFRNIYFTSDSISNNVVWWNLQLYMHPVNTSQGISLHLDKLFVSLCLYKVVS